MQNKKPLRISNLDNNDIEISLSSKKWANIIHIDENEIDRYFKMDYKKLQVELQEKYWFLFKKKINRILNNK